MPTSSVGESRPAAALWLDEPIPGTLQIHLAGEWTLAAERPSGEELFRRLAPGAATRHVVFTTEDLTAWDSSLLTFLVRIEQLGAPLGVTMARDGLPEGVRRLLALALAVPAQKGTRRAAAPPPVLAVVGEIAAGAGASARGTLAFVGEACVGLLRLLAGKARVRRQDFLGFLQESGPQAVPIVSLVSFLMGLILAFVGVVQLALFGAQIYVADLVGISMTRVLAAVTVGIVMTGRTGAAFAAQLGTMQVNEEIDALRTMGISPMEFLVVPRMLALTLMMPLLCLYADLMGILGGLVVASLMLGLSPAGYMHETQTAVTLTQVGIGVVHSIVFGVLISLTSCLRGMQCGRSSAAVGAATTSAVVTGIVSLVVATAIMTAMCNVLRI